jgi:F-type H+-transporting ATPase subunit delta
VQHVVAAGHRDCPAILSHFKRLVKLDLARHTATVESAAPLPADLQAAIDAGLTRRYGPGLSTAFAHRPALIGGMRIQVGSDVYDGSVRAGLAALEKRF